MCFVLFYHCHCVYMCTYVTGCLAPVKVSCSNDTCIVSLFSIALHEIIPFFVILCYYSTIEVLWSYPSISEGCSNRRSSTVEHIITYAQFMTIIYIKLALADVWSSVIADSWNILTFIKSFMDLNWLNCTNGPGLKASRNVLCNMFITSLWYFDIGWKSREKSCRRCWIATETALCWQFFIVWQFGLR